MASPTRAELIHMMDSLRQMVQDTTNSAANTSTEIHQLADAVALQAQALSQMTMQGGAAAHPLPPGMAQPAAGTVFAANRVKLDLPAMFTGNAEKLEQWLFAIQQYCVIVGVTVELDKVKLAVSRLEKDALTWWRGFLIRNPDSLTDGHQDCLDWASFCSAIEDAFEDVDRELKLRRRLAALRQRASVSEYTRQFRQVVLELGSRAPDEDALIFTYIEGLKDNVSTQVLLQRPTSLAEAEQLAERVDVTLFRSSRRHEQVSRHRRAFNRRPRED